jgi:hypothetical protein
MLGHNVQMAMILVVKIVKLWARGIFVIKDLIFVTMTYNAMENLFHVQAIRFAQMVQSVH